ncbi:serine/threonine protein kinase [Enhygromyxa salina]|uniref:Serine/threonine protein kinase n=1 Tax=Enhygromyxa salina TaxID=215803 RepID=A0A0C2A2I8_9BACT|nr:serine/threonine-protein kinase [Enhygromyxa salina]KIG17603.1 serine/threonine protein kinase [Enhygromyxa salina]
MSTDPSAQVSAGTRIGDRYELLELIGEGGMGAVWRARQLNLGRDVALKLLVPADFESREEALRRFGREARVASAIKHPNVIEVYDVGEFEGLTYLAMELLHGESLRDRLVDPRDAGLPVAAADMLEMSFVIDVAQAIAEALVAAHAVGAVHRDLKPENIFLQLTGPQLSGESMRVVVLDFGLAFIEHDEKLGRMTRHGVVMGTPDYLSPEQARGGEVGPASDVYSLGCVLYELLCGAPPFSGSSLNVMTQHLYVIPTAIGARRAGLPRELEELTMAMLGKHPEQRPRILEVRDQLELLAMTLSGRRKHRRDAKVLENRAERMISFSPTAPLATTTAAAASSASTDLRVALVGSLGEVAEEIDLGLLSNDMALGVWTGAVADADVILVASVEGDIVARVAQLVETGLPVIAAIRSDDRQAMGELARVGAAEVTTLPLAIDNLVRSLRRAKRRHDRRNRPR